MTNKLNVERLKEVGQTNDGHAVLGLLARRERNRNNTTLRQVVRLLREEGKEANKESVAAVFRELQAVGVGQMVYGRHGNPNRFEWFAPLKDIAHLALGEAMPKAPEPKPQPVREHMGEVADSITVTGGGISIQIPVGVPEETLINVINSIKKATDL